MIPRGFNLTVGHKFKVLRPGDATERFEMHEINVSLDCGIEAEENPMAALVEAKGLLNKIVKAELIAYNAQPTRELLLQWKARYEASDKLLLGENNDNAAN